ncbi:MAG: hypothetical protein LUP97_03320 [Methanoregula sp.]|nr:hypothetical protein [Methanoregula sp.]
MPLLPARVIQPESRLALRRFSVDGDEEDLAERAKPRHGCGYRDEIARGDGIFF